MSLVKTGLEVWYDGIRNVNLYSPHSTNTAIWYDLSGNNNHGAITSGTWQNDSLVFTKGSTWVNLGYHNHQRVTFETVIELFSLDSSVSEFFVNFQDGGYGLCYSSKYTNFQAYIDGYKKAQFSSALAKNKKHHLVGTYDGTALKLYINGVLSATLEISGTIKFPNPDTVIALGGNPKGAEMVTQKFDGKVYSARLYSRALTQSEVTQNYNYEMTGKFLGRKFLVKSEDVLYTVQNNSLVQLEESSVSSQVFLTYGCDDMIDCSLIQNLKNPEILYWQEDETETLPEMTATLTALPTPKVLLAEKFNIDDSSFKGIGSVVCEYEGSPSIALSFDESDFEYYDSDNGWITASELEGMIPAVLTTITAEQWYAKIAGIKTIQIKVVLDSADDSLTSIKFNFIQ